MSPGELHRSYWQLVGSVLVENEETAVEIEAVILADIA
jgi:hypothetical protein